ncbi:DUF6056 family protein [Desulfovibrio sp.]|uniref:DUF6056 family protein n=1 Tax=Desulfovibrio sp. TaxID=885 RepID=UPI002582602C|nr:DUF6056 family protein [Desulfovibrio sp.]
MGGPQHTIKAHDDRSRPWSLGIAVLLSYVVLAWFCAHTPYISDDYFFSRGIEQPFAEIMAGAPVRSQPPASAMDVLRRPLQMYGSWDGRVGIYLVFGSILAAPGWVYVAVTPLLILGAAFCLLIHVYGVSWKEDITASRLLLTLGMLAVALPSFGDIYFWRTGLGYAASLLGALVFLLPYRFRLEEPSWNAPHSPVWIVAFFLLGLFVGCIEFLTPILCAMLAVAACGYFCWRGRKEGSRARGSLTLYVAGAAGICLGCLIVFLAPGNAHRMLLRTPEFLQLGLTDKITAFLLHQPQVQGLFWLPYLILGWSVYTLCRRGSAPRRRVPVLTWICLATAVLGQGAYLFAPRPPQRAYTMIAVFLLAGALIAARQALQMLRSQKENACASLTLACVARVFFAIWCLALIPREMLLFQTVDAACRERDAFYARSAGKAVCVPPLPVRGDRYMVLGSYQQDMEYDPAFWVNQAVAAMWHLKSVALCPRPERRLAALGEAQGPLDRPVLTARQYWDRLDVRLALPPGQAHPRKIYVYYFGNPGLARYLPQSWADGLVRWLGRGEPGSWRQWLVPVVFAQATASLTWTEDADGLGEGSGTAKLWGLYPLDGPFWLVRPGASAASFDLLPLRDTAVCTTPRTGAETP